MMELPQVHPWFIGVQFHPEFTSTPRDGHPLFRAFICRAAHRRRTGSRRRPERRSGMKLVRHSKLRFESARRRSS